MKEQLEIKFKLLEAFDRKITTAITVAVAGSGLVYYALKSILDNITEQAAKNADIDVKVSLFFYLCIIVIIGILNISLYTAKTQRLLSSEKVDTGHIDALIGEDKSFLFDLSCVGVFLFVTACILLFIFRTTGFYKKPCAAIIFAMALLFFVALFYIWLKYFKKTYTRRFNEKISRLENSSFPAHRSTTASPYPLRKHCHLVIRRPHKIAPTRERVRKMKNVTTIKTIVPDRIHQNVTLIKILKGN